MLEPFVKLDSGPTHIAVRGLSHFQIADFSESWRSLMRGGIRRVIFQLCASSPSSRPALNFCSSNAIRALPQHLAEVKPEVMVVEDTGDLRDVADGKADEHGALRLSGFGSRVYPTFRRGWKQFSAGMGVPSPARGRTQPREAGSDEGSGEGGGRLRITALTPIGRASVLSKPRNQGLVPHRTFARKIPLFFNALILDRNSQVLHAFPRALRTAIDAGDLSSYRYRIPLSVSDYALGQCTTSISTLA